jgi:BirA family transcriptional regulator, biotin operon repressor / biotin---[acetyl-CoA-carboxylase] ligase
MSLSESSIITLDTIDSTNKYAMMLIDDDKAYHGLTIMASSQTQGKGQRGRVWEDEPGKSLLMSLILQPMFTIDRQFRFNAAVATAIADVLTEMNQDWQINVKWPNDIIVNDKKAGGVLIENVLRGVNWHFSVVGIGMNVLQDHFSESLPFATSLKLAAGIDYGVDEIALSLRQRILAYTMRIDGAHLVRYNDLLYKRGDEQTFRNSEGKWLATILRANDDGTLQVLLSDGTIVNYTHGQVEMVTVPTT